MIHTLNTEPHLKTKRLGLEDSKLGEFVEVFLNCATAVYFAL